jgi:hypothetical protein
MSDGGALAQEVITAYLERREQVAREVVRKARAELEYAAAALFAWNASQQWTPEPARDVDLAAYAAVGEADSAHLAAMRAAIDNRTQANLAAVDEAERRAAAVRAWFRERGINWGETEEPAKGRRR